MPADPRTRSTESHGSGPLPRHVWVAALVAVLSAIYLVLQILFVRPYLWPAGHGALVEDGLGFGSGATERTLLARPPRIAGPPVTPTVRQVAPGSPAANADIQPGDRIAQIAKRHVQSNERRELRFPPTGSQDPADAQIRTWRQAYWVGLRGSVNLVIERGEDGPRARQEVSLAEPAAWSGVAFGAWARRHLGMTAQILVFVGSGMTLLLLRTSDVTAAFAVMALALCAAGGGGPLLGSEAALPPGVREVMTVFGWLAAPLAFPMVGLAILYFPRKAERLVDRPWLHAVPFVAAAPMIALGSLTGLYLAGADWAERAALWDAAHPTIYWASCAAALAVNVVAIIEGIGRFRSSRDHNERRRIRLVVLTTVPGVFAYVLKDGPTIVSALVGAGAFEWPWWITAGLQLLVILPAIALTYAVAVHRMLGPRVALRRSVQYALAQRTLTLLTVLPAAALLVSLVRNRDMSLAMVVTGQPLFYLLTIGLLATAIKYRERARVWLDRRFFREQYDAREILLSLASRVPYETDPNDLTAMVVNQIDTALHPEIVAILVSGIEEGRLTPVSVIHGSADSLPLTGGLATLLRWSNEPLEIYLDDERSPARRLPAEELAWVGSTRAVLIVPIFSQSGEERSLVGAIALGEKRSEEPYTAEDRQLLASIAGQVGLGLDVARLRRRTSESGTSSGLATVDVPSPTLGECPKCGRCEDFTTKVCPSDGTPLTAVLSIPRVIDHKYRTDQLIGRGGMGAVYRAHDVRLDRNIAVKVVRADLLSDPEARARFRREAQIVARLQHPSVVSLFDYGTLPDGSAYLVMEFVRGEDLRRALQREGRFPARRVVRLMTALCTAIEAAHREGILHRDLKPENILLPQGDLEVKVLDFGVAKLLSDGTTGEASQTTLTGAGRIIGTPAYMAPEQLRGGAADARTDVFSLGVIAYELLTGDLPFGKGSVVDVAMRQSNGALPMRVPEEEMPPDLERVVCRALALDPDDRPPTPLAFAVQLEAAAGAGA